MLKNFEMGSKVYILISGELNKNDSNEHTKLDRQKPMRLQPYTICYGLLRKAGYGRGGLPQERTRQLVAHCQTVIPGNIIQVTLYELRRLFLRTYMYIQIHICMQKQLVEKKIMNLKKSREGCLEGFVGRNKK